MHDSHKTMDDDDQNFSYRIIIKSKSKHLWYTCDDTHVTIYMWWYTCENELVQEKELRMLSDLKVKIP